MTSPLIVYDRSRVVQDWKCPRSRYWNYDYQGRGIAPASTSLELYMGITIHDALATLALSTKEGSPISADELGRQAYTQLFDNLYQEGDPLDALGFAREQSTLVEGLIRGFMRHTWPKLLATYPQILLVEAELSYDHDGLRFMSKPDLVLANDDETVYVEYKSTSSKKEAWVNSWSTAVQLHSTMKAIEASTGIHVDAVIVQGLYKGYESYGKQSSPFCYAYKRNAQPPFIKEDISYEYRQGYKRFPVWDLPGGLATWVEEMPDALLGDQFPQTAPIYINDDLVEEFFAQRAVREQEIAHTIDVLLNPVTTSEDAQAALTASFPQRFDQCIPSFGRPCPYRILCHGPAVDPLSLGFTWREPHHAPELDIQKARGVLLEDPSPSA